MLTVLTICSIGLKDFFVINFPLKIETIIKNGNIIINIKIISSIFFSRLEKGVIPLINISPCPIKFFLIS